MRGILQRDPDRDGFLEVKEYHPNFVGVYFIPPRASMVAAGLNPEQAREYKTKILEIHGQYKFLTIYPISTFGDKPNFLQPKYQKIKCITLDDVDAICGYSGNDVPETVDGILEILENLPSAFTKDYAYGLGFAKPYRFIVEAVERLSDVARIVITKQHPTGPDTDGTGFYLSWSDFEQMRKEMNNIDRLSQLAVRSVKATAAHNILAGQLGVPKEIPSTGRHPYRKLFTAVTQGLSELPREDQNAVISTLTNYAPQIAKEQPNKFLKLRSDIDLVTLETLIARYEGMLGEKLAEQRWQELFDENPFILTMAFGYPVIKVRGQASVGGRKLSGDGEKITDFLVKNSFTNNTAIFEIKTPQTEVLNKTVLRSGVFTPSADLSFSINQALDQKYQFQKQIAQIKENTRLYDIESYAVHCCLVIGRTPTGDDRKKSFELFRRNSKDVEIVTFDELLEKLRQLSLFLRNNA